MKMVLEIKLESGDRESLNNALCHLTNFLCTRRGIDASSRFEDDKTAILSSEQEIQQSHRFLRQKLFVKKLFFESQGVGMDIEKFE